MAYLVLLVVVYLVAPGLVASAVIGGIGGIGGALGVAVGIESAVYGRLAALNRN